MPACPIINIIEGHYQLLQVAGKGLEKRVSLKISHKVAKSAAGGGVLKSFTVEWGRQA